MEKYNNYQILILIVLSLFSINLQYAQSFQWAKSGGSVNDLREQLDHIVTDAQGNVYGTAMVGKDNLQVDGIPKTITSPHPRQNAMIVSFACDGSYRWSKVIIGVNTQIMGLVIDNQSNIYITGNSYNTDFFATRFDVDFIRPLTSGTYPNFANSQVFFIAKYSTIGVLQWVKFPEAANVKAYAYTNLGSGRSVAMDNDAEGNLYILTVLHKGVYANGQYENTLNGTEPWPEDQLAANIGQSHHILKYDIMGNFVSGFSLALDFSFRFYDVTNSEIFGSRIRSWDFIINKNTGALYLSNRQEIDLISYPIVSINNIQLSEFKILLAFNAQGQFLWKKANTNITQYNTRPKVALDNAGNIYWCDGTVFSGPNNIGEDSFAGQIIYTNNALDFNNMHPYVAKLNPSGDLLWLKNAQKHQSYVDKKSITVKGNEVVIGDSAWYTNWDGREFGELNSGYNNLDIIRLNKETGDLINIDTAPVNSTNVVAHPTCITADNLGNYYLGGYFDQQLISGNSTISNSGGNSDFFIAKFGTNNCICQVPTCRFIENTVVDNTINCTYQGQQVYDTVNWNFGDGSPTSNQINPQHTFATAGIYNVCVTATNTCDSYTFCKLVDTTSLGTGGFIETMAANFEISPNPASENTTITFDSGTRVPTLEFYDLAGRLLNHYEPNTTKGTWLLPVTGLSSGVYYVILKQRGVIAMQKKLLIK